MSLTHAAVRDAVWVADLEDNLFLDWERDRPD